MDVFQSLADPTRRAILAMLARGERTVGEIRSEFDITMPAVSQHLKALRLAGLVRVRAEAQRRVYRLDPQGFGGLRQWLSGISSASGGRIPVSLPVAALVQARRLGLRAA